MGKYQIRRTEKFDKQIRKLDKAVAKRILQWLHDNVDGRENPYANAKALVGNHAGMWRYRIGDYRVIVQIEDAELIIHAITVGHRRKIY
ncbi:MAG: type II toxin-antitoxin system RelE/ParE family toxin [Lactobacillales bacterium]|jgi:mRNA interferase RelE/StbE|nr:type II toxin-antitoxin system RelE/ParE family toxin [Lactobacillales bacterium]